ncbi:growth arrest and DNA damage-inducible protein GADD45 alpha [Aplysia californica]|uniref:Growth arrest and DNA damage-inducible protein GADD45 alpha n=1 Tax=Aplysia californica TaxID=6500 RepID=A0ABM0K297_APLCA|nr:growth arrest and DNA damage-inducible protein GADD45 alpha [Aplysia californica]
MYTTDTLLISCGCNQFALANLSQDSSNEGAPSGEEAQRASMTISEALAACLTQAVRERRVASGVLDCAKLLGCRPGRVMLCILPEVRQHDVAVHIEHVLIRSFCKENDIRLLTVKDEQRLTELVTPNGESQESYVSCLLVESPVDGQSEADEFVCGYHDVIMARDILPKPVIQLPD